ncbi:MAG: hypothetical protein AB7O52_10325 [Planctomycetota bacterium]
MKRSAVVVVFVALGFIGGSLAAPSSMWVAEAQQPKKQPFDEKKIGSVPTEWGDLVTVTGAPNNLVLVFKNEKGQLRMVEHRGQLLGTTVQVVDRTY